MRAASAALCGDHFEECVGGGAAAAAFWAIVAGAGSAFHFDLFGDGLVAGNLLFDGLDHAIFAGADHDLLGHGVVAANANLLGFSAIACSTTAEHGAARGKSKRDRDQGNEKE